MSQVKFVLNKGDIDTEHSAARGERSLSREAWLNGNKYI